MIEATEPTWRPEDHTGHGSPCEHQPDGSCAGAVDTDLTAQEARDLADELGLDLYRAQDALAFVGECCDIADREQRPITTADVREWLKGARCGRQLAADEAPAGPGSSALRDLIADAIGRIPLVLPIEHRRKAADEVLAAILPTTRLLGALHQSAHDTVQRVIDLHERWSAAGPPLGTSMTGYFQWWHEHLAELHDAILPPEQPNPAQTKDPR